MGEPIRPKQEAAAPAEPLIQLTKEQLDAILADAAAKGALAALSQSPVQAAPTSGADFGDIAAKLALAISELTHQGDPRSKPVDPKILAERASATERMRTLIVEAKSLAVGDPRRPRYKTRSLCVFEDVQINPYRRDPITKRAIPIEFVWCLEPNDACIPLNEFAERIMKEFRASRGNLADYDKSIKRTPWLTDSGLLIEGRAPARREVAEAQPESGFLEFDNADPNAKTVRILGTSHEPAQRHIGGVA